MSTNAGVPDLDNLEGLFSPGKAFIVFGVSDVLKLGNYLTQLTERIADDFRAQLVLTMTPQSMKYFDPDEPLFGVEVENEFPSSVDDISEAGKCLALRRPTACVMHLIRALEPALLALATDLNVSTAQDNWNQLLNQIEKEVRNRSTATHGPDWKEKHEPFYTESASSFRLFKNAWRNRVMHRKAKYTEEQAEEIYRAVRSFMRHLSERLSET